MLQILEPSPKSGYATYLQSISEITVSKHLVPTSTALATSPPNVPYINVANSCAFQLRALSTLHALLRTTLYCTVPTVLEAFHRVSKAFIQKRRFVL